MRKLNIFFLLIVIGHLDLAAQKTDSLKYSTLEEVSLQTKSILNKTNTNANKINIGFMESSQIYNSVSSVVLEKQIATSIEDAMRNIPGVIKLWDATGRTDGGSFFTSRGFYTSVRARNGLANIAATNVDMSNIDRVEVIKGPSAT
jgi:iron complex outermembrane receptor protein